MIFDLELRDRVDRGAVMLLPLQSVAERLQKVVSDPARPLRDLVDAVMVCPMLTAAVMRLANEAGSARQVTTLGQAVSHLSEEQLVRLAIGAGLGVSTNDASPLLALRRGVMQDALSSALICERLAPEFDLPPEELSLAGLLHDIGTLIALATLEQIITLQSGFIALEATAWMELAERHHVELGLKLATHWGLPIEVRKAIERHHLPDDGVDDVAAVVRLSDQLLQLANAGVSMAEAQLPGLERVPAPRRAQLFGRLEGVAGLVAGFEEQRPFSSSSSILSLSPTAPPRGRNFPVRLTGGLKGELRLLSARHLLLRLQKRLPENYLVEAELEVRGVPMKLWVRVNRSSVIGADGFSDAEVVPFAPALSAVERLDELWNEQARAEGKRPQEQSTQEWAA